VYEDVILPFEFVRWCILSCFCELGTCGRKIFGIMSCVEFMVMGELSRVNKHGDGFIKAVPSSILSYFLESSTA